MNERLVYHSTFLSIKILPYDISHVTWIVYGRTYYENKVSLKLDNDTLYYSSANSMGLLHRFCVRDCY